MYYQKMYPCFVLFMRIICETNVIICVCLSASQLVSSLPAVVPVSLPRLVSTAAGAVNSKGKEKDFSFLCGYAAVLKGYPTTLPIGYSAQRVVIFRSYIHAFT